MWKGRWCGLATSKAAADLVSRLVEYLKTVRLREGDSSGYYTVRELSDALGVDTYVVREAIRALKAKGDILIGKKLIEDLSGRYTRVAAYKIAERAKQRGEG